MQVEQDREIEQSRQIEVEDSDGYTQKAYDRFLQTKSEQMQWRRLNVIEMKSRGSSQIEIVRE